MHTPPRTIVVGVLAFGAWISLSPSKPSKQYEEGEFFGVRWRWRPISEGDIIDLVAFCPACDYQLERSKRHYDSPRVVFECDDCGHQVVVKKVPELEIRDRVVKKIQQQMRAQYKQLSL